MPKTFGPALTQGDVHKTTTTQEHPLGLRAETEDGRVYRYGQATGTAITRGLMCAVATPTANHVNQAVQAASAVGDTSISVTLGATNVTADRYAGGYIGITDEAGEGITYRIVGHDTAAASATFVVEIEEPGVQVALTTNSEYSLIENPYRNVILAPLAQDKQPVGVPNVNFAENEYGWFQTRGICSVQADEAFTTGQALTFGTGVKGNLETKDAAGEPVLAIANQTAADGEHRLVTLTLE